VLRSGAFKFVALGCPRRDVTGSEAVTLESRSMASANRVLIAADEKSTSQFLELAHHIVRDDLSKQRTCDTVSEI
jgi:hypothetical protein